MKEGVSRYRDVEFMIIGVCGFGSTGSSSVSDFLMEYESLSVADQVEFTWLTNTDGLLDLEQHIMHPHSRVDDSVNAIIRYRQFAKRNYRKYCVGAKIPSKLYWHSVNNFLDSITNVSWDYYDLLDESFCVKYIGGFLRRKIIPRLERKLGKRINMFPMEKVSLSLSPDNFYDAARKHVKELMEALGADFTRPVVLDQPYQGNNPQACFPFYDDPYAIVVDRDPRDNYVFARTKLLGRNHYMAVDSVEDYIKYFKAMRHNQPYIEENDHILRLRFEDMVYNYDETTEKIKTFLHLGENPNPKSVFDPKLSIANTQVWKKFPEYAEDIKKIEAELSEYLYDFEKYGDVDTSGEMFFGKSPLHKKS